MSSVISLSPNVSVLLSSLLAASKDSTRVWLRAEMDQTVDPMLHSIFNRLTTKLTNQMQRTQSAGGDDCVQLSYRNLAKYKPNAQIHQPSTFIPQSSSFNPSSSHYNLQFVNMHKSYKQLSQSQLVSIKDEIGPMPTEHLQSCSCAPVSNEQSNHNLTDQHSNNNEKLNNSQINLPDTEMQPQPQKLAHIKHNQFDDEECDCEECVDGGIEVKEEDDEDDQVDEESPRPVTRPKMDTTQPNNAQAEFARQSVRRQTDEVQSNKNRQSEEGYRMENGPSDAIDIQTTFEEHFLHNSDKSMVIQQEERNANNAIGEESRSNECTTNPIQPNLAQLNRHLQCSHCHKSFDFTSNLQRHLRVHTGDRPFQCEECGKRYKERGTLAKHKLIHQNIKNLQCHECDKQFSRKEHLDSHLRKHSGDRPFECRHCEKSFAEINTRNRHEQAIHHHVKPYRCKQCGHTAAQLTTIITHIRVVHFGLPRTIKQQRALNIIDHRDPRELIEKV